MRCALAIGVACLSLVGGCFREVKEQVTGDSAAFLVIQGSGEPVTVLVDGAVVAEDLEPVSRDGTRLTIARGSHEVHVLRGGKKLVERRIYVGEGETRIISLPAP